MQTPNIEVEAMREIPAEDSADDRAIRKMLESVDGFIVHFATGKALRGYTCLRNVDPSKGGLGFPAADERVALQFIARYAQGTIHPWSFSHEGAAGSGVVTGAENPILAVLKWRERR